jgi:hypothetical protein
MEIAKQLAWLVTKRDVTTHNLHYYIYGTDGHDPIIKVNTSSAEGEWTFVVQARQLSIVVLIYASYELDRECYKWQTGEIFNLNLVWRRDRIPPP